jgi:tetratricopeptide (TPR) repeat protein/tRNA A-37 threonylcarbamoyl transferase component Bud32
MLRSIFEQLNCGGPTLCGTGPLCGKEDKNKERQDPGLANIFALSPLNNVNGEAAESTQIGVRLLHEGRTHEALRELHSAQRRLRGNVVACNNLGCAYHMSGNDESALSWYREAQCIDSRNETAVLALAWLEQKRGMPDEAQWLLVHFLQEVDKNHQVALRQLARLHESESDWSQAANVYNRLVSANPGVSEYRDHLQQCLDKMPLVGQGNGNGNGNGNGFGNGGYNGNGNGPRGNCDDKLHEAARLRDNGSSDAALQLYKNVLRNDSRNTDALLGATDCYADLGDQNAALESAKQILSCKPDHSEGNLRVAELLLASGSSAEQAEPYLRRAANAPGAGQGVQLRVLCATAEVALAREDFVQGLKSAAEAVRIDASAPRALILLGTVRLCVAEYQAALRTLSAASEACDTKNIPGARRMRAQIHALMAQGHERMREYAQALSHAQKALDIEPQFSKAHVARAMALNATGRGAEAESELGAVLQRSPQNASARLQLGYMQLTRDDPKAVGTFESVITGSSANKSTLGCAKVYLALALENLNMSRNDRSERVVKEGLQLHRNLAHVWCEIEKGLTDQPLEAVQRLRGICDMDLSSLQARTLLSLLARAHGRNDLNRALSSITPPRQKSSANRQQSVPPRREAPIGVHSGSMRGGDGSSVRHRSMSPAPWGNESAGSSANSFAFGNSGASPMGNQLAPRMGDSGNPRGRSQSPAPWGNGSGGYPQNGSMGQSGNGSMGQSGGRRGSSVERQKSSTTVELAYNEVIRPEQLTFGPALGAGGSAQVYRGSWQGQEVAIKKISGVAHLEEMTKEINALRRLRHPRLVRFIGACIQPPLLLVVTEFMAGGSLYDRLFDQKGKSNPLSPQQRSLIAVQMAEGLTFLHAQKIVHRDVKSMNILLDAGANAKICDFGLAQQMNMESTHITRKSEGEGGSPRYMAPECYDPRHGKLTEKVDIWALACILIEVFAGVLPYADCMSMAQLSARILVQKQPPQCPTSVAPGIRGLIASCFNFNCDQRPSALDVHRQLQQQTGQR